MSETTTTEQEPVWDALPPGKGTEVIYYLRWIDAEGRPGYHPYFNRGYTEKKVRALRKQGAQQISLWETRVSPWVRRDVTRMAGNTVLPTAPPTTTTKES